jgi:hypothetical protein
MDLNDIADLVKSLGKAEKRFFKMMALTEGDNIGPLVDLFDAIEKEAVSIEKLEKSDLSSDEKQIQLYELILKSLRNFYAESNFNFRIKDEILNLRCLFDKAQYKQCRKMLNSLKRELYELEEFGYMLKVFDIEKKLIFFEDGKKIKHQPLLIANEEQSVINKELRLNKYLHFHMNLKGCGKDLNYEISQKDLENPLVNVSLESLSLKEQVFVFYCKEAIYTKLQNAEEAIRYKVQREELVSKHTFLSEYFVNINTLHVNETK